MFACFLVRCRGGCADPLFPFFDSNFRAKKVAPAASDALRRAAQHLFLNTMLPCSFKFVHCNDARPPRPNAATTSTTVPWLLSITGVMSMKVNSVTLLFEQKCVYITRWDETGFRFQPCLQVEFGPLRWDVIHRRPFFTH